MFPQKTNQVIEKALKKGYTRLYNQSLAGKQQEPGEETQLVVVRRRAG